MPGWIAVDIETALDVKLEQGQNYLDFGPVGITCAAIVGDDGICQTYYGKHPDGSPAPMMSAEEVAGLVYDLMGYTDLGYKVTTWNGTSFDWQVIAWESGLHNECVQLALAHYDPMFQILCIKGFPVGLDAIAKGLGLPGKTEGMHGDLAPKMWAQGKYREVLEYVTQDARSNYEIAIALAKAKQATWTTKAGKQANVIMGTLLTVDQARATPAPDTSWMTKPITRAQFLDWMKKAKPLPDRTPVEIDPNIKVDPYSGELVTDEAPPPF